MTNSLSDSLSEAPSFIGADILPELFPGMDLLDPCGGVNVIILNSDVDDRSLYSVDSVYDPDVVSVFNSLSDSLSETRPLIWVVLDPCGGVNVVLLNVNDVGRLLFSICSVSDPDVVVKCNSLTFELGGVIGLACSKLVHG